MIVFVLKAIAGKLQELYPDCTVQRAYIPEQDRIKLGKMDRPLMSVILDDRSGEALDRSGTRIQNHILVDVVLQKMVKNNVEEIDPLIDILEELFDLFAKGLEIETENLKLNCNAPLHGDDAPIIASKKLWTNNEFIGLVNIDVSLISHASHRSQNQTG